MKTLLWIVFAGGLLGIVAFAVLRLQQGQAPQKVELSDLAVKVVAALESDENPWKVMIGGRGVYMYKSGLNRWQYQVAWSYSNKVYVHVNEVDVTDKLSSADLMAIEAALRARLDKIARAE